MKQKLISALLVSAILLSLCGCMGVAPNPPATEPPQLSAEPTLPFKETAAPTEAATEPAQTTAATEPVITEPMVTEPAVTEPMVTEPMVTEPMVTEPMVTEPGATEPAATEPRETQPAATEPRETQPPATEPSIQIPDPNPYVNEAGQTVFYYGGGNLVFGWDENGEPYSYVVPPDIYVYDVTPRTLTVEEWNSWSTGKQIAFRPCFYKDLDDPETYHNYLWVTQFNGYDCGYEGHACRNEQYHNQLMEDLATPCYYCGKTNCPSYLAKDPETLFTKEDSEACPEYDKKRDPFFYCQKCHKTKWGNPSESCNQYLADVNCYTCGEPVKAHACHTCAFDEDIYDEYENKFTAEPPVTTPTEPTEPAPTEHVHSHRATHVNAPSCRHQGYTVYTCECGDSYQADYVDPVDHMYTATVVEPTASAQGYTEYVCFWCGDSYRDNFTPMLPTEPNPKVTEETEQE